jgi:hypothetical protein
VEEENIILEVIINHYTRKGSGDTQSNIEGEGEKQEKKIRKVKLAKVIAILNLVNLYEK